MGATLTQPVRAELVEAPSPFFSGLIRDGTKGEAVLRQAQDVFAAAQIDSEEQISRKIQLLDADTFVVSGVWNGTSKAKPENNGEVRCTDVFQKGADGAWIIVNEHCSQMPKAA